MHQDFRKLAQTHYENFPVGSFLIPRRLRPHVHAVYAFARTADDFADEMGPKNPVEALEQLKQWDDLLDEAVAGRADHPIFIALAETIRQFDLPPKLFHDLVHAFRQDVTVKRYRTMENVVNDYCRYSANPVGRLVLLLHGYRDEKLMQLSDSICTALQLANFWQDIAIDLAKDRIYLPQVDLEEFGVTEEILFRHEVTPQFQALMRHELAYTRRLFEQGVSLLTHLRGRLRWEIRATWLGGMGILDRIEQVGYDVFRRRPKWSKWEMAGLLLRSVILSEVPPPSHGFAVRRAVAGRSRRISLLNAKEKQDPSTRSSSFHSEDLAQDDKIKGITSSNFYFALRFLPKEKREAMFTFYRFCRAVDDAVDLAKTNGDAHKELTRWEKEVQLCYTDEPTDPVTISLVPLIQKYQIPKENLDELLAGVEMDLEPRRYETFDELEKYCYRVASVVGLVSSRIFGCQHPNSRKYAIFLGQALQLINILRDLKQDVDQGRIYLPQNDMKRFGYSEEKLQRHAYDDSFMQLIQYECARARALFLHAENWMPEEDRKKFFPARIMADIYQRILDRIEHRHYDVFSERISVPIYEKIFIALKYKLFMPGT